MISTLYKGSVKDVLGPARIGDTHGHVLGGTVFHYTDAYSVFDWGKMPDGLPNKGQALSIIAADLFEKIQKPENWKNFSRTAEALGLRKGISDVYKSSEFNDLGEKLQTEGLRTHFLGPVSDAQMRAEPLKITSYDEMREPFSHLAVRQIQITKPLESKAAGRSVMDYRAVTSAPAPKLIPLEVVFRFSLPEGSSLIERVKKDPSYLSQLLLPKEIIESGKLPAGYRVDFPILELFTKLESTDRPLAWTEALAISGLSGAQLQDLLFRTAWAAGFLKAAFHHVGLELADGKFEWGMDQDGSIFMVDSIGPDELRILKNGMQLSKEVLRHYYRKTKWYEMVGVAKRQAQAVGSADWKKFVGDAPPALPEEQKLLVSQMYQSLTNVITGREWFKDAPSLDEVCQKLKEIAG